MTKKISEYDTGVPVSTDYIEYVDVSDTTDAPTGTNKKTLVGSLAGGGAVEGTAVLSTGETGATKFLREDGDGSCSWQAVSGSGDVVGPASSVDDNVVTFDGTTGKLIQDGGQTVAGLLARANHTGTQLASTISDFDTEVSNNSDVSDNTTHRTSDGTDHIYINQDVTSTGTPSFTDITVDTTTLVTDSTNDRVGVGTASPDRALHVLESGGYVAKFQQSSSGNEYIEFVNSLGNKNIDIAQSGSDEPLIDLYDSTGATRLVRIFTDGESYFDGGNLRIGNGNLDMDDNNIVDVATVRFNQELDNGSKTASFSVDFSTDQKQKVTLTANTMTLTLDTTSTGVGNYILKIVNGGLATLTIAGETGSVYWPGGTIPTLTSSGTDIIAIYFDGTDFYLQAGLDFS